jgi:hypothetical protein
MPGVNIGPLANPASGVGVLAGAGQQFLSMLQGLPGQIGQWQQIQQQRQQQSQQQLTMLTNLGQTIPGIASNPQYARAVEHAFGGLGLGGVAPISNGTVDVAALGPSPAQTWLRDPTNHASHTNTPVNERAGEWNDLGFGGQAPDWWINSEFRTKLSATQLFHFQQLSEDVTRGTQDPLAAILEIQGPTGQAIDDDPNSGLSSASLIASIRAASVSPALADRMQHFADTHNMLLANYREAIVRASELIPAQAAQARATAGTLIPSEAARNYASADEAQAQVLNIEQETNLHKLDYSNKLYQAQFNLAHGRPPGLSPDQVYTIGTHLQEDVGKWQAAIATTQAAMAATSDATQRQYLNDQLYSEKQQLARTQNMSQSFGKLLQPTAAHAQPPNPPHDMRPGLVPYFQKLSPEQQQHLLASPSIPPDVKVYLESLQQRQPPRP